MTFKGTENLRKAARLARSKHSGLHFAKVPGG